MPNYIYSNPFADAADTFSGAGALFGNTLLQSNMMRQRQAERQQEMMMQLLSLQQRQGEFEVQNKLAGDEFQFRKDTEQQRQKEHEASFALQQQQEQRAAAETESNINWRSEEVAGKKQERMGRTLFANAAGQLGIPDAQRPMADGSGRIETYVPQPFQGTNASLFPTLAQSSAIPTDPYSDRRIAQIGIANALPPNQALETILKLQAMHATPMSPELGETLLTGRSRERGYNVPPGSVFVSPEGSPLYTNTTQRVESPLNYPQIINATQLVPVTNSQFVAQQALRMVQSQMARVAEQTATNAPRNPSAPQQPQGGTNRFYSPSQNRFYIQLPDGSIVPEEGTNQVKLTP